MPTWSELEQRFHALQEPMRFARLDRQTGTDGEHWRVAALSDSVTKSRFEAISTMAGRRLLETPHQPPEIFDGATDLSRWYRRLAFNSPHFRSGVFGHLLDDYGKNIGWVSSGSIDRPAEVAATMCLELIAMADELPNVPVAGSVNITLSGPNSRLNIGSADRSTNVILNAGTSDLFEQLRQTIESNVQTSERDLLIERLDALKAAVDKPTLLDRYKDFIQAAANHATVVAPFLPALTSLLK